MDGKRENKQKQNTSKLNFSLPMQPVARAGARGAHSVASAYARADLAYCADLVR